MTEVVKMSPDAPAAQVGFGIKFGSTITDTMINNGTNVTDAFGNPVTFKLLHVGGSGNIVVRGVDGKNYPIRAVLAGAWIPAWGTAIVYSDTFNGVTVTTNASLIDWYSGV